LNSTFVPSEFLTHPPGKRADWTVLNLRPSNCAYSAHALSTIGVAQLPSEMTS
jgi:hypothetical protein